MSQYRDTDHAGDMLNDAKSRLRDGLDTAKSKAADTRDYVSGRVGEAKEHLHHMTDDMRDRFDSLRDTDYDEVWDGVKTSVRENPGPALLIAGAVGLALGVLLAGSAASSRRHF